MNFYVAGILGALVWAFAAGCSTTDGAKTAENLDIGLKKEGLKGGEDLKAGPNNLILPPDAKVDWEQYFKSLPPPSQRQAIEAQLAVAAETSDVAELLKRGRNEVALGRHKAAEATLRQALRNDPKNLDVLLELAQLYIRLRQLDRSFEYLAEFKSLIDRQNDKDPTLVFRFRYVLATAFLERHDTREGRAILSDLVAIDKAFTPGYAALAGSYLENGKVSVADFIARRGLDRGKDDAALYNILGVVAERERDDARALKMFNRAVEIDAAYVPALINRANVTMRNRQFETAESDLQKAIVLAPASVDAYVSLGVCKKNMGVTEGAKIAFEKAISLNPESAVARFNLGVLHANELKQPNVALRLFHETLQSSEKSDEVKALARSYIEDIRENRAQ